MFYDENDLNNFFESQAPAPSKEALELSAEKAGELRSMLLSLEEHPGFIELQKAIKKQITSRLADNLQIPNGLDGVTRILYINGEIAGLKLAHDFVKILVDSCKEAIDIKNKFFPDEQEQVNGE